jgi:hypothetical protein
LATLTINNAHLIIVVDLLVADTAWVDGGRVGVLGIEDHGLVSWVDLLAGHGQWARPSSTTEIAYTHIQSCYFNALKKLEIRVGKKGGYESELTYYKIHPAF